MSLFVEMMGCLTEVDWKVLDEDYNGYDGEPKEGELTNKLAEAGIGRGSYDIPKHIWNDCVPEQVIGSYAHGT